MREVLYVDLTGDGIEESVVPNDLGGTLGNIARIVVFMLETDPAIILTRRLE